MRMMVMDGRLLTAMMIMFHSMLIMRVLVVRMLVMFFVFGVHMSFLFVGL